MICSRCGAQNPDGSAFCNSCGNALAVQQAQPMQPVYVQAAAPVKKSKAAVIAVVCGVVAVIAAFLVVLFVVILPKSGGSALEEKLSFKWSHSGFDMGFVYDFRNDIIKTDHGEYPIEWEIVNGDHILINADFDGVINKSEFSVSVSDDGKTLTMRDVRTPDTEIIYLRVD